MPRPPNEPPKPDPRPSNTGDVAATATPATAPLAGGRRRGGSAPGAFSDGQTIAERYRIVRFIAAGGMGEVYEAMDTLLHRRLALKTIRASLDDDTRAV